MFNGKRPLQLKILALKIVLLRICMINVYIFMFREESGLSNVNESWGCGRGTGQIHFHECTLLQMFKTKGT